MSRHRRKQIYLLGFMGSGKSTVGELLSRELRWPFIDLDAVIEAGQGVSIREIFERSGELFFRQLERAALTEVLKTEPAVIALGGGTFAYEPNLELIRETGGPPSGSIAPSKSCDSGAPPCRIARSFVIPNLSCICSIFGFPTIVWQNSGSPRKAGDHGK